MAKRKGLVQNNVDNCVISPTGYKGKPHYVIEHFDAPSSNRFAVGDTLNSNSLRQPGGSMLVNIYISRLKGMGIELAWDANAAFYTIPVPTSAATIMIPYPAVTPNKLASSDDLTNPLHIPYSGGGSRILVPKITAISGTATDNQGRVTVVLEYINI